MNRFGDVELDARGMRALAHPVRVAILRELRAMGASTASRLAPAVGASPSVVSWHLRHLAEHGLVEDDLGDHGGGRSRWWRVVGRGFRFTADHGSPEAASALFDALQSDEGDVVGEWTATTRPRLEPVWAARASRWNTLVGLSADELQSLNDATEALLAPFVNRSTADQPDNARVVRVLRYVLPEADGPGA